MQGAGWTCAGPTCVRSDALAPGSSYPAIALTVDVAKPRSRERDEYGTVSGGGSTNASASDPTTIYALPIYSNPLAFAVPASVIGGAPTTFTVTYASQAGSGDIAAGLNGFTGLVNLQIGLAPGWTNPCFSLWGSIPI